MKGPKYDPIRSRCTVGHDRRIGVTESRGKSVTKKYTSGFRMLLDVL